MCWRSLNLKPPKHSPCLPTHVTLRKRTERILNRTPFGSTLQLTGSCVEVRLEVGLKTRYSRVPRYDRVFFDSYIQTTLQKLTLTPGLSFWKVTSTELCIILS